MHLYLLGLRGTGKSTIGRLVATKLERPFLDLDDLIEQTAGQSISEIFRGRGEPFFRELEARTLEVVAEAALSGQAAPGVVALGGGACERNANRELIRRSGRGVWLQAPAEVLFRRLEQDVKSKSRRPALTDLGSLAELQALSARRAENYAACAEITLATDRLSPAEAAEKIVGWWQTPPDVDKTKATAG
ncbi:MAG: shikimate kinase [Planctomycetota bacterium]